MNVSVIIPAYNVQETLAATLDSLCAQTHRQWEAFIVDDGSTDDTASIAATYAGRDPRLHFISQTHQGACAARNHGLSLANFDWLLFLDADDILLPTHLQRMTAALEQDPQLDAVHCDWQRITLDGQILPADPYRPQGQLFATFARRPLFPPFSCLLRRHLVLQVGAWDTSFDHCQDWDLLQRCARTGAQFGVIDEVLGYYRMRPYSLSTGAPFRLLRHGLRVIQQGYSADKRVRNPDPALAAGLNTCDESNAQLIWLTWCAGLALGLDKDTRPLLQVVEDVHDPDLDPHTVADCIFRAGHLALGQPPDAWRRLWPQHQQKIEDFLRALEAQSRAPDLAKRSTTVLQRLIAENIAFTRPLTIGQMHIVHVNTDQPLPRLTLPESIETLCCEITYAGHNLEPVLIAVSEPSPSPEVIAGAIAGAHAWSILGFFFQHSLYPQLRLEKQRRGLSLWRGDLRLARNIPAAQPFSYMEIHDDIGWTLFLQEVWGKPTWPQERFYDPGFNDPAPMRVYAANPRLSVEVSDELPDVVTGHRRLEIILTVGGAPLGRSTVAVRKGKVTAQAMRAALTEMGGFELCRLAVRQGLIGRPLSDPLPLRRRLQQAAASSCN